MSPEDRRLAALASVYAKGKAKRLLAGLSSPDAAQAAALAEWLEQASRGEKLATLAQALRACCDRPGEPASLLRAERPRVAAVLAAQLPPGLRPLDAVATPRTVSPLLARLCAERAASLFV